ncbi:MAG: PAS domain-containing protein, partial [Thermodesulfobacteriota bacterium]
MKAKERVLLWLIGKMNHLGRTLLRWGASRAAPFEKEMGAWAERVDAWRSELARELKETHNKLKDEMAQRRQTEETLRRSEARYQNILEKIHEVVFVLDKDGRFNYVSPSSRRATRYGSEELLGRPFSDFLHPGDRDRVERLWRKNM